MADLLLIFILLVSLVLLALINKRTPNKSTDTKKPSKPYQGVSIDPFENACFNVLELKNKRFLATQVSTLPVIGCNTVHCKCKYIHHADRRYPNTIIGNVFSKKKRESVLIAENKASPKY